ncbi:hypothetical protein GCM10025298_16300 [Natronobiforma cellulositropha]
MGRLPLAASLATSAAAVHKTVILPSLESPVMDLSTPRTALYANLGLVITASVLALLELISVTAAALMVVLGFAGVAVSILGMRSA